jgi:hypothetical protein
MSVIGHWLVIKTRPAKEMILSMHGVSEVFSHIPSLILDRSVSCSAGFPAGTNN